MRRRRFSLGEALSLLLLVATLDIARADFLDETDQKLSLSAFNNQVRLRLSGTLDLEGYYIDQPPPGLIFTPSNALFNPRLIVFIDAQIGPYVSVFVQARVDRGFDPSDQGAQVRLDEYGLRVSPWKDVPFAMQAGKFATVVGNWVPRHYSWDNPFVNAPLPYENLTGIWDSYTPENVNDLCMLGSRSP